MARLCCLSLTGILVTGADTGAAGTAHFEPGGVIFWSKTKKTRRGADPAGYVFVL
jgi:hypothetical protein